MWKLMLGGDGLYPADAANAVAEALKPGSDHQRAILEIGSGSGSW